MGRKNANAVKSATKVLSDMARDLESASWEDALMAELSESESRADTYGRFGAYGRDDYDA